MTKITKELWMKNWDSHVTENLEYSRDSLGNLYSQGMARFPERPACWMIEREISFGELLVNVQKFATFLQDNGLKKGDIVVINLPNSPQYLIAHFGTILAGGVASGLNLLLSEREIAYQLNDSGAKAIVTLDAIYDKRLRNILNEVPRLEIIIATNVSDYMGLSKIMVFLGKMIGRIPRGKVSNWSGKTVVKFLDIMNNTKANVQEVDIDIEKDLALLQYTGGTTGFPKGTELTHANIIAQHTILEHWLQLKPGKPIILCAFPMFHLAGLALAAQSIWLSGAQILIPDPRDIDYIIDEIIEKKPTHVVNVPTLYNLIMKNPKSSEIPREVLDNIDVYVSGAAPFPSEMIRDFEKHMHAENKVMEVYGMTETSPVSVANPFLGKKKVGKVGLPLPDTEIKLIDLETDEPVETGVPGEILVRGPIVTRGYLNKPEATKTTIEPDGWLHTGDVGIMDEDGYIKIVDRVKDMLNISGYKVYSVHVEDILTKHSAIDLVAIIGIDDPNRPGSEIVKAFVKLKSGIEVTEKLKKEIKVYAEENLSKYEMPKQWEFREELPLTTIGKVLKKALRGGHTLQSDD
ncbi:MAG: AMP-binding protein [Candidatus Hermodarchaeota archaeon]